jgi:hypothetical protein
MPLNALRRCGQISRAWIAAAALALPAVAPALAQDLPPPAPPEEFDLELPAAAAQPGGDRRVIVADESGQPQVAQVLAEVGDRLCTILPDGRLLAASARDATATDRPFVAAQPEAIVEALTTGPLHGFKSRTTRRYVYVFDASDEFCEAAGRILETMYPKLLAYCQRAGLAVHDPPVPLVVIVFRTQEQFQRYRAMPEGVVAYYSAVSNRVVMYEQSDLAEIAPDLAARRAISTIAHEGVHQVLHNIGVQQRLSRWPLWFGEGLPEFFAPTEVGKRVRWKGVGLVNDLRLHTLREHLAERTDLGQGNLLRETVEAESLDGLGYARAWALVHFLATSRREEFDRFLLDASRLEPLAEPRESNLAMFVSHFGDDLPRLETALLEHVRQQPYADPMVYQTHFVAWIRSGSQRRVLVTTAPGEIEQALSQWPGAEVLVRAYDSRDAARQAAASED